MPERGGMRPGAGRPKGRMNKATLQLKGTLEELARSYTATALNVLVDVAQHGQSEAARVSAANSILDRGYGRPRPLDPVKAVTPNLEYDVHATTAEIDELIKETLARFAPFGAQALSSTDYENSDSLAQGGWNTDPGSRKANPL